jgi:hypothetical protein
MNRRAVISWASTRKRSPLTTGGQHLHRHYRVPRELANLIAELAGIGPEHQR